MGWELLFGIVTIVGTFFSVLGYYKKTPREPEKASLSGMKVSLAIEHRFPGFRFSSFDEHEIEVSIASKGSEQLALKKVDWALNNSPKKSSVKVPFDYPYLIPQQGVLFKCSLGEVLLPGMHFEEQSNWEKCQILKRLQLEVIFMTNNVEYLPVPRSMKVALFRKYSSESIVRWIYEWFI